VIEMWRGFVGGLALRRETMAAWAEAPDGFRRGVLFVALTALIAGSLTMIVDAAHAVNPPDTEAQRAEMQAQVERLYSALEPFLDQEVVDAIRENTPAALDLLIELQELPTPLPNPTSRLITALGVWLSAPITRLGGWFGYTVFVLLVARLLGGTGGVRQMFAATALASAPRALGMFGALLRLLGVGALGGPVAVGLWVWSVAIYVRAVGVASRLDGARSLAATVVPALALAVLIGCLVAAFGALLALAVAGAG
jgi:hypothetical protein